MVTVYMCGIFSVSNGIYEHPSIGVRFKIMSVTLFTAPLREKGVRFSVGEIYCRVRYSLQ